MRWRVLGIGVLAFSLGLTAARAVTVTVYHDPGSFDLAAGAPPVSLDFDAIAPGTQVAGTPLAGLVLTSPDGNTLEVVEGNATVTRASEFNWFSATPAPDTNKLFPTSGANVLSPGGTALVPGPQLGQKDSLQIDFLAPVNAFGLDLLFQSLDGASFTDYSVVDTNGVVLASGTVPGANLPAGGPGGALFIGFVADADAIARVVFTEYDDNNGYPDANIGYDTFRYPYEAPAAVPEPGRSVLAVLALMGVGAVARRGGCA